MKIIVLVANIFNFLNKVAPFNLACDFDNVGLLIGDLSSEVSKVLITLDLDCEVFKQAKKLNVNLIITHHPVIFHPVKSIEKSSLLFDVVCSKINVICAHTNLDIADDGVSFNLAKVLNLKDISILPNSDNFGRLGFLSKSVNCEQFLDFVSKKLKTVVKANKTSNLISKIAVVSGAGGSFLKAALSSNVQAFVTGECKHSDFIEAVNRNVCLVEAGHFETENFICEVLKRCLVNEFLDVQFFVAQNSKPANYFLGDYKWL